MFIRGKTSIFKYYITLQNITETNLITIIEVEYLMFNFYLANLMKHFKSNKMKGENQRCVDQDSICIEQNPGKF